MYSTVAHSTLDTICHTNYPPTTHSTYRPNLEVVNGCEAEVKKCSLCLVWSPNIPFTWANAHWSLWFEHIPDSTVLSIPVKLCCFWPAFYSYKKTKTYYILRTIIECNNIFDTNILSRGYPTKLKIYTNSRGVVDYEKRPLQCIMKIPGGWQAMTSNPYSV